MTTNYEHPTHHLSSSSNNIHYTADTLGSVYMHSVSGEQYKLSVGEGKHSVGEVKLSVGLTGCHSGTTEIAIAS